MSRNKIITGPEAAKVLLETPAGRAKMAETLASFGLAPGEHKGTEPPAPAPARTPPARPATFSKALINVTNRHLPEVIAAAWQAELSAPIGPDSLFVRDGKLVRLDRERRIVNVSQPKLKTRLHDVAEWVKRTAKADETGKTTFCDKPGNIPDDAPAMMIETPHPDLPELEAVITTPVFGASGNLIAQRGYHADDKLWYAADGLALEDVPLVPTDEELRGAVDLLLDLVCDVPFASESDRTHWIAMALLPFVWRLIDGPFKLHLIEASTPGTGKSLLAKLLGIIVTGGEIPATPWSRKEEEVAKTITAKLRGGDQIVFFDNVRNGIDSETLAATATGRVVGARTLGVSDAPPLANDATWVITANNPQLSFEVARRFLRIRLVALEANPHGRDVNDFRHPEIYDWTRTHRSELVRALLVLVRAWQAAGSPAGKGRSASFEGWVKVIGGIVQHAGLPDFLESSRELMELADVEGAEWRAFVGAWYARHKRETVTATTLLKLIDEADLLTSVVSGLENERAKKTRFSRAIGKERDRVFDVFDGEGSATTVKLIIGEDKKTKARVYRLAAPSETVGSGGLL